MKKLFFLLTLLCSGVTFAQTIVKSHIMTNTTWTMAGSPYLIDTSFVNVDTFATLTIEPGVKIQFTGYGNLKVYGSLYALGTSTDSIEVIGGLNSTGLAKASYIWIYGYAEFEYTSFSFMNHALNSSYHPSQGPSHIAINHCHFSGNTVGIRGRTRTNICTVHMDSSLITDNDTGIFGAEDYEIRDCVIQDNREGIKGISNSIIERCEFLRNGQALSSSLPMMVHNCDFSQNNNAYVIIMGFRGSLAHPNIISDNRIVGNLFGLGLQDNSPIDSVFQPVIYENKICNDSFNVAVGSWSQNLSSFPLVDLSRNCWCEWDSTSLLTTVSNSHNLPMNFMPIDSSCLPSLVFPGDANHDQIANNFDLLPIGLHFNQTGTARPNASNTWIGQRAANWNSQQSNGRDIKHVDCNGDGTINWNDTLPINLNYGLTHNSWRGAAAGGGTSIRFSMPTANLNTGDTVTIPIELGTFDTLAMNVYGIAFSINYDIMVVDSASARVSYANSWLGTKNTDMLTLHKDFPTLGQLDMALVRNNQQNRTGYGSIADLIVVISDDLSKRDVPFVLEFSNIRAIDSSGQMIEVRAESGEATVDTDPSTGFDAGFAANLKAYPNPIEDQVILAHDHFTFRTITLISITGQQIPLWEGKQKQRLSLTIPRLTPGIYMLVIDMEEGRKTIKVELR